MNYSVSVFFAILIGCLDIHILKYARHVFKIDATGKNMWNIKISQHTLGFHYLIPYKFA